MAVNRFKVCPKCSSKNDASAKFCLKCGTDLQNVEITTNLTGANVFYTNLKSDTDFPIITTGAIPVGFSLNAVVEVLGAASNYTLAWNTLIHNVRETLTVRHLDGIANYKVILSPFQTASDQDKVALILYGDGIIRDSQPDISNETILKK